MKKLLILILALTVSVPLAGCDLFGSTTTTTTTVSTEPDLTVYPIGTAAELAAIDLAKNYILTADIDLQGAEWVPLGDSATPYSGTFEGDGFTISNFVITEENAGFIGLFGNVTGDLVDIYIEDGAIDVSPTRMAYVGLMAAYTTGSLTNCHAQGTIAVQNHAGSTYAGLLVGLSSSAVSATTTAADFIESVITQSSGYGTLEIASQMFAYVGGLIGKTFNVELTECSVVADITVSSEESRIYAGGLVGHNFGGILVGFEDEIEREAYLMTSECIARTKISVTSRGTQASVGGLYGYDNYGHVEKCASFLDLTAAGAILNVGGLSGENWNETVINSAVALLASFETSEGQTIVLGGMAGVLEDDATIQNSFYRLESAVSPTTAGGASATLENYGALSWYRDTLLWEYPADLTLIMWASSWLRRTAFVWE